MMQENTANRDTGSAMTESEDLKVSAISLRDRLLGIHTQFYGIVGHTIGNGPIPDSQVEQEPVYVGWTDEMRGILQSGHYHATQAENLIEQMRRFI